MPFDRMKRREFISLVGGGSLLAPYAASAQQAGRTYRLAFLSANAREAPPNMGTPGANCGDTALSKARIFLSISAGFQPNTMRFPEVAAALVKSQVDAVLCSGEIALRAAQQATRTVPILGVADDMLAAGTRALSR